MRSDRGRSRLGWTALALVSVSAACAACDPLIDVAGAFFPAWMLCILVGIATTAVLRHVFSRARLEPSLGPLVIVYPSLAATISLALWLGLYRRTP